MVPACVARVHLLLPPGWDWSGARATPAVVGTPTAAAQANGLGPGPAAAAAAGATGGPAGGPAGGPGGGAAGSTEDLRERGELQRVYYAFLLSLVLNDLSGTLLRQAPAAAAASLPCVPRFASGPRSPALVRGTSLWRTHACACTSGSLEPRALPASRGRLPRPVLLVCFSELLGPAGAMAAAALPTAAAAVVGERHPTPTQQRFCWHCRCCAATASPAVPRAARWRQCWRGF